MLRPCPHAGCGELVKKGKCERHKAKDDKAKQQKDKKRETAAKRGYGYRWQKYRLKFLAANPLCSRCQDNGAVTAATVVDHKTPVSGKEDPLFWCEDNHQSLCRACHDWKTKNIDCLGFGARKKVGGGG